MPTMTSSHLYFQIQSFMSSEEFQAILNKTKGRDIIMFLGNRKAGKASIINYLMEIPLLNISLVNRKFTITDESTREAAGCSIDRNLETTFFRISQLSGSSAVLVDPPEFADNTVLQDVVNAIFIREVLSNAKSAKFIILSDIQEITNDNISSFLTLVDRINRMFRDNTKFRNGMLFCFTNSNDGTTKAEVCELLRKKILDSPENNVNGRDLIKFFIEYSERMIITRTLTIDSALENDVFANIRYAIKEVLLEVAQDVLSTVSLGILDMSHTALLDLRAKELRKFEDILQLTETIFKENIISDDKSLSSYDNLKRFERLKTLMLLVLETWNVDHIKDIERRISAPLTFIDDLLQMPQGTFLLSKIKGCISKMSIMAIEAHNSMYELRKTHRAKFKLYHPEYQAFLAAEQRAHNARLALQVAEKAVKDTELEEERLRAKLNTNICLLQ